jgi:hypothetical protein
VSEEPRRSSRVDRDGFIAPSQISHAVSFGIFLVHPCRDVAGCARTVGAAIRSKDKGDRSLQRKQRRVKLVRVRSTMHSRRTSASNSALSIAICLSEGVGQPFAPLHNEVNRPAKSSSW